MHPIENESSLLEIELELELELSKQPASKGRRFVNYIIDSISCFAFLFFIMVISAAILQSEHGLTKEESKLYNTICDVALCSIYLPFYTLSEWIFKGRSIGKFFTKTKTIRLDGKKFTIKDAFLRSLIRLIPIEPFSAFSSQGPWHDRWTKTRVVTK